MTTCTAQARQSSRSQSPNPGRQRALVRIAQHPVALPSVAVDGCQPILADEARIAMCRVIAVLPV
jgi:hypothetical protein